MEEILDLINRTTVLLMAREGSKRFKNKNIAEIVIRQEKKTLLNWKIEQLLEIFEPERILLSSDSTDYLDIGLDYKISLHLRDKDLVESGSFADNLRAVAKLAKTECVLYANGPCNPLIGPRLIREFLENIEENDLDNGTFAVENIKGHLLYQDAWLNFEPGDNHLGSESLKNPSRVVWPLSCRRTERVISQGSMFSVSKPSMRVPSWAATDIDYEEDLVIAEAFLGRYLEFEGNKFFKNKI